MLWNLALILGTFAKAGIRLPALFSDGVVLQQNAQVSFWGWANPGERVIIQTSWKAKATVIANAGGKWKTLIRTPAAGGPFEIIFKGKENSITIKDVLTGEVWLCAGQSNMGFKLKNAENGKAEVAKINSPEIRFFKVEQQFSREPLEDAFNSKWQPAKSEYAGDFSAVAFYFAQKMQRELKVPIGIIQSSWGGTPAEAWTPVSVLSANDTLSLTINRWKSILKKASKDSVGYNAAMQKWKASVNSDDSNRIKKPVESQALFYSKRPWREPGVLFNGMIHPLMPYKLKGILWYQGESNVAYADEYNVILSSLIKAWRNAWEAQLPFYIVQIAPFGYSSLEAAATLREAQYKVSQNIPQSGVIATADIGNMKNAHPVKKRPIGERLANMALARNYGYNKLIDTGPAVKKIELKNNNIIITFNQEIKTHGGELPGGFEIGYSKDENGNVIYKLESAEIKDRNKIIITIESGNKPVEVRYAWKLANNGNLFNSHGLPAYPFRENIPGRKN